MKFHPIVLAAIFVIGIVPPLQAEDVLQNFSGMLWGAPIDDFRDLRKSASSGDIAYYKRDQDFYSIGGVTLPDVVYGFFDGKFFAAFMKVASVKSFEQIKRHLDKVYGPARAQLRINQTIYIWDYLDVKIKLKQYGDRTDGKLAFYYIPLSVKAIATRPDQSHEKVFELEDGPPEYDF